MKIILGKVRPFLRHLTEAHPQVLIIAPFARLHDRYMERRLAEARDLLTRLNSPDQQLAGLLFILMQYQDLDRNATLAFQREIAMVATLESLDYGRGLRADYMSLIHTILEDGVRVGLFRPLDVPVQSLLIFGATQWTWTWFRPGGRLTALEAGAQLVHLCLGSLLVDRRRLDRIADPAGKVAQTTVAVLTEHLGSEPGAYPRESA
ncbi:TetR/AcrR family transcriptional regulator [Mycolicibacter sp. MYC123]|uniref:TetR/AcrR family transcriptional regulator n=1 Tax=[Mycobacterium] zoologicum TaxID=2872311 RepID=A0ABU5YRB3_9MYCO|nr:hypothetical protein [Mycolicibacter sp. MYC123]MEB3052300.1 TetR/AcrR family transcriptional regulator [Mycolicibacter sp. MYC123]